MAPGHIIPMIDMAKLLSKRGVDVTIIVTHVDAARFSSVVDRAVQSGLSIHLLKVQFPCEEAGLPLGCESADLLPSHALLPNFSTAINLLQNPVEHMLSDLNLNPSCIISDKNIIWTVQTCEKLQIPRLVFDGMSCFTQLVTHNLYISKIHETVGQEQPFVVPGLPHEIQLTRTQLPGLFNPGPTDAKGVREKVMETEILAYGMVVNTFEEMENPYVQEFRKLGRGKIWCIGPLSLCSSDGFDRVARGDQASDDSDHCLKWLDSKRPGSVVYACLGSLSRLTPDQFVELALGLEASSHPFIIVLKGGAKSAEIEKWISDEGIEGRIRERGLLFRGWAPQVAILSHPAVRAFLTHCGWNSTLEGLSAGLPMITWPMFAEQFLNEKVVVEIQGIGVGVGAQGVGHLGVEEKAENKVTRGAIEEAVRRVMDERDEGCERRKRAKQLGEIAKRSVEEGGSSYLNITRLVQDIAQQNSIKGS